MILETKNLWLKTTEQQDVNALHENYWSDLNSARVNIWRASQSLQDSEKKMREMFDTHNSLFFTIVKKDTKQDIGMLTITRNKDDEKKIDNIGIGFSNNEVHKGYGSEVLLTAIEFCFGRVKAESVGVSYLKNVGVSDNIKKMFGFEDDSSRETEIKRENSNEKLEIVNLILTKDKWEKQKALIRGGKQESK